MNVFHKVTVQSLKKNKTRTIVTIIGIMLSTALICAVTTSLSSVWNFALRYMQYESGCWHGSVISADYETYEKINSAEEVKRTAYVQYVGYSEINSENEFKPYLYITAAGGNFEDIMPVHIISGRFPQNSSELLIPEHLSENGEVYLHEGDTITLDVGDRMSDGYLRDQNEPNFTLDYNEVPEGKAELSDETLVVRETKSYTVVGIYERPDFEEYTSPGYTALTVPDGSESGVYSNIWFEMKKPSQVYEFMNDNELHGETNYNVLMLKGVSRYSTFYSLVYGLAAVVIGLIMFGSISLIYNAFSISVSERTKQFGLLSSVGATKKQLRKMVSYESLVLSVIGIPLGILLGIAGIGVTLLVIGDKFSSFVGENIPFKMTLSVSPASIIVACAVALITIRISAWIPSRRATKITAVEAIRQSTDIRMNKRSVKTPKLIYKIFGLPGMLAQKYFKRSKKRYRSTIVSLFMSMVLFISASAFTGYLVGAVDDISDTLGFDIVYHYYNDGRSEKISPDELLAKMKENIYVNDVAYSSEYECFGNMERKYADSQTLKEYDLNSMYYDQDIINIYTSINFVNDEEYLKLLDKYDLDKDKFMNPDDPMGIAFDHNISFDVERQKYVRVKILASDYTEIEEIYERDYEDYYFYQDNGDGTARYISINGDEEYKDIPTDECYIKYIIKSGKTISDDVPFFVYESVPPVIVVYPYSFAEKVMPENALLDSYSFRMTSDDPTACYQSIQKLLMDNNLSKNDLYNYADDVEKERNLVVIIKVFAYGFIVLISLIAAANVFNTITTNVNLRRREFAMLRSVGMTSKGLRRMMNFECIMYGTKALIYGLPVSAAVTFLIYLSVNEGIDTDFTMPWKAVAIAVFSVFAVVFITMMYSMWKIRKDNPVETLKNENM